MKLPLDETKPSLTGDTLDCLMGAGLEIGTKTPRKLQFKEFNCHNIGINTTEKNDRLSFPSSNNKPTTDHLIAPAPGTVMAPTATMVDFLSQSTHVWTQHMHERHPCAWCGRVDQFGYTA